VHDVDATLAKAERLGGTRAYGPMAAGDRMKTGACAIPPRA